MDNLFGQKIEVGDYIAYPISYGSSSAVLKVGVVVKITNKRISCLFLSQGRISVLHYPQSVIPLPLEVVKARWPAMTHILEFANLKEFLREFFGAQSVGIYSYSGKAISVNINYPTHSDRSEFEWVDGMTYEQIAERISGNVR